MPTKPKTHTPKPLPSEITWGRVRDLVEEMAARKPDSPAWLAVNHVIDLMNGWDGKPAWPKNASLERARKKLQFFPGSDQHERPTSSQMSAVRRHLDKLVDEKLVEKERGHTDGNNSWGYRWITDELVAQRRVRKASSDCATALARQLSLALGGDGTSGAQPFLTPDGQPAVRVNLYGVTAERILTALSRSGLSPDFYTGLHWEIIGAATKQVMGCTSDRGPVRDEEPEATFREVKLDECSSCRGKNSVPPESSPSRGPCPECVEYGSCVVHPEQPR